MKNEIIFSELHGLVNEKSRVSAEYDKSKWTAKEYTAGKISGQMLVTTESGYPEAVSFDLNLEGRYKIFICLPKLRSTNYLYVKLSGDLCYTGIKATDRSPINWTSEEYLEEVYWKSADLTGQKLIISKADATLMSVTGIAWIRCIPEETPVSVPENKCMQMHIDEDVAVETPFVTGDEYVMKLFQMQDSNVDFVSFEVSFDYDGFADPQKGHLLHNDDRWDRGNFAYRANKEIIYKKNLEFAKKNNIKLYATNRMQVSNFVTPFTRFGWNMKFVEDNSQYYCKTRTGTAVKVCSYAYPEVQDFVIKQLLDTLEFGFDGLSLIFHRGMFVSFEEPVVEKFKVLYPDVDPFRLPFADPRLHGVWCDIINGFMHKLREAVGKDTKINVITNYDLASSKHIGLDVEYWAKHGLIDSASQGDMETREELDGCMCDNNPNYIDLAKYQQALEERTVVRRYFGTDVKKVCAHIEEYARLKETYGIETYHTLPWVHSVTPEDYAGIVAQMTKAGAEKFLSWNTNHLVWDLPEWHTVKRIGNQPVTETLRKFYRVLSFDGTDISQYHPNWRG